MNKKTADFLLRKVLFLSAIFLLTLFFSCKKDGKLTPDFENGDLTVLFTDTFSVVTEVVQEDSLRTDLSNTKLLGLYNDLIYGPVSSSIYTQVLLTGANVDFGATPILDSIVLILTNQGVYGDGLPLEVEVYKLDSSIDVNIDYYSTDVIARASTPLAYGIYTPGFSNDLRIRLDDSLGDSILINSPYVDNAAFSSVLKGLYITIKDSVTAVITGKKRGSIVYFDLNSSNSTVSLYYHYGLIKLESLKYNFIISEAEKFSHFEHNYTGTDVEAHLGALPTKDTTMIYVSTMAGVKTKIDIPNIKDLTKDGSVSINKAELIFTIEDGTDVNFADALSSLSLVGINSSGDAVFLLDALEGIDHYGGILVDDGTYKTYTFNITRHIHQLVYNTTIDYGMYLIANASTTSANRVVISSENSLGFKIKLEITYSKF